MDIQLEKYMLMEWLVNLKDETIISKLKQMKASLSDTSDWADDISETEKSLIKAGLKDVETGNTKSHDQVMKEIKAIYDI
jgi:predicted transcriptional regulator